MGEKFAKISGGEATSRESLVGAGLNLVISVLTRRQAKLALNSHSQSNPAAMDHSHHDHGMHMSDAPEARCKMWMLW